MKKTTFNVTQDLLNKWRKEAVRNMMGETFIDYDIVAKLAAQWGADQELKACYEILYEYDKNFDYDSEPLDADKLFDLRRPKSTKEKVLDAINKLKPTLYEDTLDPNHPWVFLRDQVSHIEEEYFDK